MNVYNLVETLISLTKKGILHWGGRLEDYGDTSPILHSAEYGEARLVLWHNGWLFRKLGFYSLRLEIDEEIITFSKKLLKNLHRVIKAQLRSTAEQEGRQKEEEVEKICKNLIEFNNKPISS